MSTPPRFVVRTLVVTLVTVAFVLSAVLAVVALSVRERVRAGVVDKLETGQRLLAALEQRRTEELLAQGITLAENPTLKAALDTYHAEMRATNGTARQELVDTIARELEKLSARIEADVLAVRDPAGVSLAVSGTRAEAWREADAGHGAQEAGIVSTPAGIFRVATVPVMLQGTMLGTLQTGTALDERYAQELAQLSGAEALIVSGGRVAVSTLASNPSQGLAPADLRALGSAVTVEISGTEYAVRELVRRGGVQVYVLASIDRAARSAVQAALQRVGWIALGAFLLAGLASLWLARTVARPVDTLSHSLARMTATRDFDHPLPATGESLEVDALTTAFNTMMASVRAAEAETLSAYLGAIRALALALDARDPYTAGHSERVSAMSLAVGRQMLLDEADLEVLRLGALLHDIGKIGISDAVLRKPGPLTREEYEIIKTHPGVGARILRSVPFLAAHIPIVELHHERPDGRGYPHGLQGDQIPLLARIVHVADAFDAITSARAYRPARESAEGLRELWRSAGSEFDAEVVQALAHVVPGMDLSAASGPAITGAARAAVPGPHRV